MTMISAWLKAEEPDVIPRPARPPGRREDLVEVESIPETEPIDDLGVEGLNEAQE